MSIDVGMIWNGSRNGTIPRKLCDRKVEVLVWIFGTILSWVVLWVDRPFKWHHLLGVEEKGIKVCTQAPKILRIMQA
ncbi:hypothetical protein [Microcoleus sp. Pol11C3]|uniref:hypothetical protein n=1 Tax=Microcoleus sp. Pol11C3 TaxID=3055390 RepID=UPI002FD00A00